MAQVRTNKTSFRSSVESALETAGTSWDIVEVNSIGELGKVNEKVMRDPISTDRQRRKGAVVGRTSGFRFEAGATLSHLESLLPAFMFADYAHPGTQGVGVYAPTAAVDGGTAADSFTVAADGDLVANELIFTRGFANAENNGLFVVAAGSTPTSIKVPTASLVAEASPPANVMLEVAGIQGASGDFEIDANGDLISTLRDFTTLNLSVGQFIKIGGTATNTFFATAANNAYARIDAIAANKLTLSKRGAAFALDNGAGKTIQIFYGRFLRQYDVDHAKFIERSYTFEVKLDDLLPGPADHYMYPKGNYAGELTINFPLKGEVTMSVVFVGTDTESPTTSRKTGASTALSPAKSSILTTSGSMWKRLRITEADETGVLSFLKQGTLKINNNVAGEDAQAPGVTGHKYMNYGNHHPDFEGTWLFEDKAVVTAIEEDRTMSAEFGLRNSDGAIMFDFPAIDLSGGGVGLPVNETVTIQSTAASFKQTTGVNQYSMSVSLFPHIPS